MILNFYGRMGDTSLLFGQPWNWITTHGDDICISGNIIICVSGPFWVWEGMSRKRRVRVNKNTVCGSANKISKNLFDTLPVICIWFVHKLKQAINDVHNVWSSKWKILKAPTTDMYSEASSRAIPFEWWVSVLSEMVWIPVSYLTCLFWPKDRWYTSFASSEYLAVFVLLWCQENSWDPLSHWLRTSPPKNWEQP